MTAKDLITFLESHGLEPESVNFDYNREGEIDSIHIWMNSDDDFLFSIPDKIHLDEMLGQDDNPLNVRTGFEN